MSLTSKMADNVLIEAMEVVQEICTAVHAVRTKNNIRNRQPLASFTLADPEGRFSYLPFCPDLVSIIKEECNVKAIVLMTEEAAVEM